MNRDKQTGNIIHPIVINEIKLPEVIDGMAMLQVNNPNLLNQTSFICDKQDGPTENLDVQKSCNTASPSTSRVLRRRLKDRSFTQDSKDFLNRRVNLRPKKRPYAEMQSEEEIKDYYLDKRIKTMPNNLETIFEEENLEDSSVRIGKKKLKRLIHFNNSPTIAKLKKRQAKAKLLGKYLNKKKCKISMESVIRKLNSNNSDYVHNNELSVS